MTERQQIVVLLLSALSLAGFFISQPSRVDFPAYPIPAERSSAAAEKNGAEPAGQPLSPSRIRILGIPVSINTATADQLTALPGIGPQAAQAILAHRERIGKFQSPDELLQVPGIGPRKLSALRHHILIR